MAQPSSRSWLLLWVMVAFQSTGRDRWAPMWAGEERSPSAPHLARSRELLKAKDLGRSAGEAPRPASSRLAGSVRPRASTAPLHSTAARVRAPGTCAGADHGEGPDAPHAFQICQPHGPVSKKKKGSLDSRSKRSQERGRRLRGVGLLAVIYQASTRKSKGV